MSALDRDLLEILICPRCRRELTLTPQEDGLVCPVCKLQYPVRDGVPVLLPGEADPVE